MKYVKNYYVICVYIKINVALKVIAWLLLWLVYTLLQTKQSSYIHVMLFCDGRKTWVNFTASEQYLTLIIPTFSFECSLFTTNRFDSLALDIAGLWNTLSISLPEYSAWEIPTVLETHWSEVFTSVFNNLSLSITMCETLFTYIKY